MPQVTSPFLNPYPYPSTPYPYREGYGFIMKMHGCIYKTIGFFSRAQGHNAPKPVAIAIAAAIAAAVAAVAVAAAVAAATGSAADTGLGWQATGNGQQVAGGRQQAVGDGSGWPPLVLLLLQATGTGNS